LPQSTGEVYGPSLQFASLATPGDVDRHDWHAGESGAVAHAEVLRKGWNVAPAPEPAIMNL
jgi:hypothetical protein